MLMRTETSSSIVLTYLVGILLESASSANWCGQCALFSAVLIDSLGVLLKVVEMLPQQVGAGTDGEEEPAHHHQHAAGQV
jgi:hypothetical protein